MTRSFFFFRILLLFLWLIAHLFNLLDFLSCFMASPNSLNFYNLFFVLFISLQRRTRFIIFWLLTSLKIMKKKKIITLDIIFSTSFSLICQNNLLLNTYIISIRLDFSCFFGLLAILTICTLTH